ncbi:MAG: TIGR01244 family phosphatase [Rhodovulum sp.]|jgi:sulfide:quinone oxidoreductase|nr:TIGR01244 family phosphatase [Rhodovulum sp.]|tara:strand:- start:624 stop:1049 length:426 start_codon:yes stop_codon:yes gene_type:complete
MDIRPITPDFAASPQISVADVATAAAQGYRTLICNRPDGEEPGQPDWAAIEAAAKAAGMETFFLPVSNAVGLTLDTVEGFEAALANAPKPVLAYCRSGTRSTMAWGVASAATTDPDTLVEAASKFGYDLNGLRPAMDSRRA